MSDAPFPEREARARRILRALSEHARQQGPTGLDAVPALSRYEIRERLGEGATAVVYRAWDRELSRLVALKVLKESQSFQETSRQRFRRESQVAAGLSHPNIVPVYDVGEENGRLFIVMELVDGRPLNDLLRGASFSLPERLSILERVARGVAAAHARGIVHRDLKPGNILVTPAGEPKVADFGLAHLQDSAAALTRTGSTLGTPLYMAPEQVRGRVQEISPRTDVYALGAVLYELVGGRPPHGAETLLDLYEKILNEDPASLPNAPADLSTIARKALSKDPARRYPSAAEFAEDLRRYAAGEAITARPETFVERMWRKAARRRGQLLLAATIVLAVVAVAWIRGRAAPTMATVEEASGDVQLASETGATGIGKGYELRSGQMLRTGPRGAAVLKAAAGARLSLGADTMLQAVPGNGSRFFVALGMVSGDGGPLSLRTPHGQVDLDGGGVRADVFPTATWLETRRGTARVRRLGDGATVEVREGNFIAIGAGRDFAPRPAAEGLLGYWPFEEVAGNVARDASGHGNDGVFLHAPIVEDGKKGKGAGFDGMNFVEMPGLSGATFPASGTLAFWVKGDFTSQEFTELFDRYEKPRRHLFLRGMRNPHGLQVVFQHEFYWFDRVSPIAEAEWNHVAVTWDTVGGKGALYLNGSLTYTAPIAGSSWVPDGQFFRIGGMGYSATAFRGVVDEVRLYGTPLGPEAIRDLYGR